MSEINILEKLVSYNTIKDKENKKILDYIENFLSALGFETLKKDKYLIMSIGENPGLGFIGHSDTVDYIDGWSTNPFKLTQKGNELYGLGSCDMKGGIAAFLQALTEIDLEKIKKGIKIYITYDEEISFSGINDIVKTKEDFPEYIIVGEPTNNKVITGCKGLLAIKIFTFGDKIHSSRPDKGKNANSIMIKLLNELESFYESNIKIEQDIKFEVPYTTMNIGLLNGGNSINSLADKCEAYIDFRILKNEHMQLLKNKLEKLCGKYEVKYEIDFEILSFFNEIDFVSSIDTACFMTEASFIEGKRIILGTGPVTAHEIDEHVSIDSLRETVRQYKNLILQICK
ncbi:MAG: M20/M25/M40 family metallo-hydrolase [Clostridia bacterium]